MRQFDHVEGLARYKLLTKMDLWGLYTELGKGIVSERKIKRKKTGQVKERIRAEGPLHIAEGHRAFFH